MRALAPARATRAGSKRAPRTPAGPSASALASARDALVFLKRHRTDQQVRDVLGALREVSRTVKRARRDGARIPDRIRRDVAPKALRHVQALLVLLPRLRLTHGSYHLDHLRSLEPVLRYQPIAQRQGERVRFAKFIIGTEQDAGVRITRTREVIAWAILARFEDPGLDENDAEAWKKACQRARKNRGHIARAAR